MRVVLTANEAIRDPELAQYDLIVLDVKLQGSRCTSVFERIRALSRAAASGVLFVTGDAGNAVTRDLISDTGRPMLAKPFTLDALMLAVTGVSHVSSGSGRMEGGGSIGAGPPSRLEAQDEI